MFLMLWNTREEREEISQSDFPIAGMLNCHNEGNCSTPAMVGASRQIHRIWPDPSLPLAPTLRELVSFVVWWKIYTVKQISIDGPVLPKLCPMFVDWFIPLSNCVHEKSSSLMNGKKTPHGQQKKPCLVYKIAQSSGIFIKTMETVQISNEIRFPVAAELFWLFLCVY